MRGQVRVTARRVWIRLQRLSTGKPLRFRFGLPWAVETRLASHRLWSTSVGQTSNCVWIAC